jgi:hypothetical protein
MRARTDRAWDVRTVPVAIGAALAAVTVLIVAAPALAHPYVVDGGRVPVHSLATIELDLAHGCGVENATTGPDTDEVALEVPTWLRVVDAPQPDGWVVTFERSASRLPAPGGPLAAVVWTATTGAMPAPRFSLDVVIDGEAGETRYLRVSQRCGDLVERWIGTPDEPADQPAVRLRLEPADPDRPAPPASDPATARDTGPDTARETGPGTQTGSTPEAAAERDVTSEPTARPGRATATIVGLGGASAVGAAVFANRRLRGGRGPSR